MTLEKQFRRIPFAFLVFICIQVLLASTENSWKLQRFVIREINLNKFPVNKSFWINDGFQESNATQISRSLNGAKLNVSASFLMGTTMAKLHTILTDFKGRFLSIKFSSMIGKSRPVTTTTTTTITATKTTPTTTTRITTITPSTTTSTAPTTTKSTTTTTTPPTTTKTTTTTTTPTTTTTSTTTTTPSTTTTTTPSTTTRSTSTTTSSTSATLRPPPEIHLEVPVKSEQPAQVIEISMDNTDQIGLNNNAPPARPLRRKRELSSEGKVAPDIPSSKNEQLQLNPQSKVVPTVGIPVITVPDAPTAAKSVMDAHTQYKTWKASLSQSFRPSGFYVLVDDHVVYDNWEGVWILQEPNVLGKHVKNSPSDIWSHTEILLEWNETPNKDLKVRFEWDPPTTTSFLFLSDIVVSTVAMETDVDLTNSSQSETLKNKDMTVHIVVQLPEAPTPKTSTQRVTNQSVTPSSTSTITTTTHQTTTTVPISNNNKLAPIVPEVERPLENAATNGNRTTTFIVIVALGSISLFILIALMHTKFKENKRLRGTYC